MFPFISGLLGAVSTGLSLFGSMSQASGQKGQSNALQEEEIARRKQMTLDFQRQRLEAIRGSIISSSMATAAAANQGALHTSSLLGGKANVTNTANFQLEGINQNNAVGNDIFKARQDYYNAGGQISFGQGVSNLGGAISGNIDNLSRLGTYAFGGGGAASSVPQYSSNRAVTIGSIP